MSDALPASPLPAAEVQVFALHCFSPPPSSLALGGSVTRDGDRLQIHYRLQDPGGLVRLPPPGQRSRCRSPPALAGPERLPGTRARAPGT